MGMIDNYEFDENITEIEMSDEDDDWYVFRYNTKKHKNEMKIVLDFDNKKFKTWQNKLDFALEYYGYNPKVKGKTYFNEDNEIYLDRCLLDFSQTEYDKEIIKRIIAYVEPFKIIDDIEKILIIEKQLKDLD